MTTPSLACDGCGAVVGPETDEPFRCPGAVTGDGVDHVLQPVVRNLDDVDTSEPNPFVRYRRRLHSHRYAMTGGWNDDRYVDLVRELDEKIATVACVGFRETPLIDSPALADAIGLPGVRLLVKDETGQVSGSHKARHLMAILLQVEVAEALGRIEPARPLAIASCGNAAIAAATLASAVRRDVDVFVPDWASSTVIDLLRDLDARVHVCRREADAEPGDPCYLGFRMATERGAIPFCCQGPDNCLNLEGGRTLAWEVIDRSRQDGTSIDRAYIQVGGGALASAFIGGAREAGAIPRIAAVQTAGAAPLSRAVKRVRDDHVDLESESGRHGAAAQRARYMWPWEEEPKSLASGILDDETYDWLAVARGVLMSEGTAPVVDESEVRAAWDAARDATGIDMEPTASAGLAGLMHEVSRGRGPAAEESALLLFTGRMR